MSEYVTSEHRACGCHVYCPMHAAAPEMQVMLVWLRAELGDMDERDLHEINLAVIDALLAKAESRE